MSTLRKRLGVGLAVWLLEDQVRFPDTSVFRIVAAVESVRLIRTKKSLLDLLSLGSSVPTCMLINGYHFTAWHEEDLDNLSAIPEIMILGHEEFWGSLVAQGRAVFYQGISEALQRLVEIRQSSSTGEIQTSVFKDLKLVETALIIDGSDLQVELTPIEARILRFFIYNPSKCLPREEIMRNVWRDTFVSPRSLDSHISRLRRRLASSERTIENVYGSGYVFS